MKLISKLFLLITVTFSLSLRAQLNGAYSVPGTFTSLAAAISSLNAGGVSGAVTINIAAGYTETSPVNGYQLNTINGCSAANYIVFKKSGTGSNPLISAFSGGVGTPSSSTVQNGIWKFIGSDFITVDGIDLIDPNTANPATMEYGFGFFKSGGLNGCQYNTIKNCVITLNRINAAPGSGVSQGGSKGIYLSGAATSNYIQDVNVNSAAGSHSFNKFYANRIQDCQVGISIAGYNNQGYVPYSDQLNDVGGPSAATGNTIVNFGGATGSAIAYGIDAGYQYSLNVSNNVINNNNGAGLDPANHTTGIRCYNYLCADVSINSNTITLISTVNNSLSVNGINNTVSFTTSIGGPANVNINNNVFPSYNCTSTPNNFGSLMIFSSSYPSITNINNNLVQNLTASSLSGIILCPRASTCNISSNTITNMSFLQPGSRDLIDSDATKLFVANNFIDGATDNSPLNNGITCISGGYYSTGLSVTNNTFTNIMANQVSGVRFYNNLANVTYSIVGNQMSGFSTVPSSTLGAYIMGISIDNYSGTSNATVSANSICSLTASSLLSYTNISSYIIGISAQSISNLTLSGNRIYSFASNRYGVSLTGFTNYGGNSYNTASIFNNLVGDFQPTNTDSYITGIGVQTRLNTVYFNTVYLDAANTGSNTSSSALYVYSPVSSATTTLRNNILVNTSQASGSGTACAISIYTTGLYGSTSDRNILYAGTPASNRLVARIGVNSYSMITTFKSAVYPRDMQTFTDTPVFASTLSTAPNLLSLNPTVTTLAESGAMPVPGITVDYAGNPRDPNNPDIGAWEGNFPGFDRAAPLPGVSGFTALPCGNFTSRTFTMAITDASGVAAGSLSPRVYYRVNSGSYTSVQGVLSSGTATNGVWTFNLTYNTTAGSTISYYVALQDQSSFNNVVTIPGGGIASSVNSIITPPTPYAYTLQNYPVITVNSGSICTGQVFQINAFGASTYTYSSGTTTVNPLTTTVYSVTGTSSSGCPATNTAIVNVTVNITPTISVNSGSICYGGSFTLNPTGASGYTYSSVSRVVSPLGNVTYTVQGKSAQGCLAAPVIASVTVIPLPAFNLSASAETICIGESANLEVSGSASSYSWEPDGQTSPFIIVSPTANITYTVTGTNLFGCSSTSVLAIVVSECTELDELSANGQISLAPNPSNGQITIRFSNPTSPVSIRVFNAASQLVHQSQGEGAAVALDLASLPKGLYFVNIQQGGKPLCCRKIVLE